MFIERKDGTGIGKINSKTGKPFRDPEVAVVEFGEKQILQAGRKKARAIAEGVATRGDKGVSVPDIHEIKKAQRIRFEVKADTPRIRTEVEARVEQLRREFPAFSFEARFGS